MDIEQLAGTKLGNYKIESLLGRGGMGVVYKATQISLKRPVALKILLPTLSSDLSYIKRFQREAEAVAKLSHANILHIYDVGEDQNLYFFGMEYIEGRTLDEVLKEKGRLDPDEAVGIITQAAEGIEHAHENNIIHRDIKPSNIILDKRSNVKVMDFGLARVIGKGSKLTQSGTLVGTLDYMSPEQCRGEELDERTDIYSLGVVLYEMLTGNVPFDAPNEAALIHKIVNEKPIEIRTLNLEVPPGLSIVLASTMAKEKENRYSGIPTFLQELSRCCTHRRETRPMNLETTTTEIAPFVAERTPFVGRKSERYNLRRHLGQAANGKGTLIMIGGEPGVGKTRIAEELVAEAHQHGFLTLTGHCYDTEGAPPYMPFVEIIESAARISEPGILLATLDNDAPEVAKLLPELRERFPDIPEPAQSSPEQERWRMFNGIVTFIARAAKAQPLLFVIEDLQWTDEPTLLLLQHIVQRLHEMPVLIVGTYRDTELDVASSLARTMEELLRRRRVHDIILKRLSQTDVSAMLQGQIGQKPPGRLVEAIYHETEGNPFFVEEIFKHLTEEEKLLDAEGRWRKDIKLDESDVPRGVRLVIERRLNRVSDECRRTLRVAAIIGRGADFKLLNKIVDLDEDALFDAIDDAERARLISSGTHVIFAHELIRQTLLGGLSTPRRRRLHRRVAEAMEQLYADALENHAADLAHHFFQAGTDMDRAIDYATRAGNRSFDQLAYEEAVKHYKRALQAIELEEPSSEEVRRCELLLHLGEAQVLSGQPQAAKDTSQQAAELARSLSSSEHLARASSLFSWVRWHLQAPVEPALHLLEEALSALGQEDSVLRVQVLSQLCQTLVLSGSETRMRRCSQEALEMAKRIGNPETLFWALHAKRNSAMRPDDVEELLHVSTELVRLAKESNFKPAAEDGHEGRIMGLLMIGDMEAVNAEIEAHTRVIEDLAPYSTTALPMLNKGMLALLQGLFEECNRLTVEALEIERRFHNRSRLNQVGQLLFALRREQGRLIELESGSKNIVERYPNVPAYRCALALLYSHIGNEDEARKEFERLAVNDFRDFSRDAAWLAAVTFASEVCAWLGDATRAEILYELLRPYAQYNVITGRFACSGSTSRYLGLLATTFSRFEQATKNFEDALEMNTRIGAKPFVAHTQHEYAWMLIKRGESGDSEKAKGLLTESSATYRKLGMPTFLEDAETLLAEL
jgi:serine/threonine protein kinase/tetratricopeptide (TPR) repeat protein